MDVKIKTIAPMKVAYIRHHGPYETCHEAWIKLYSSLGKSGQFKENSVMIGVSYDDPKLTPPEKIRYDACVTVNEDFVPTGDVRMQEIGGGYFAVTTHVGSYSGLKTIFAKIRKKCLTEMKKELRDAPCLEIYLDDPEETPEDELRTEICLPITS